MISTGWKRRTLWHARHRAHCFVQAFDAAKSAAGRTRQTPATLVQRGGARFGEPHPQLDSGIVFDDVELADFRC